MRRFVLAVLLLAAGAPALAAERLSVPIDHAVRLQTPGSAATVIVGDPAVADVTVIDSRTLFISGRGYGLTEVVVLDAASRTIWQGEVVVTAPESGQVSVYRGATVTEMACEGSCAPSVRSPAPTPSPGS